MNDIKSEYRKARRRVQSRIYRLKKKGYDTSSIKLPSIPKKVTAGSIRRLERSFNSDILKKKAKKLPKLETTPVVKKTKAVEKETPEFVPNEFDVLVDMIQRQIDNIPNIPLPFHSKAVGAICSAEFNSFVNSIEDNAKEEAVDTLRGIMSDSILNLNYYESEQIAEAKAWGAELESLASRINSSVLADVADEVVNAEFDYVDDATMPWGENWRDI